MKFLPTEMKVHILSFLDSWTLESSVSFVCEEWKAIARQIVEERVLEMEEIFASFPPYRNQMLSYLPSDEQEDKTKVLRVYENSYLGSRFVHKSQPLSNGGIMFLHEIQKERGCDCQRASLCIVRSVHFMPCHCLILVQMPERIDFYSMLAVLKGHEEDVDWSKYKYSTSVFGSTTLKNIWIDNNTHTSVSVYGDRIVSQETTRALILFRVKSVDHSVRSLVLENLRRIFLPLWSCDLILMPDKVCAFFTTGSVGIWRARDDDIQVSENFCVEAAVMRSMHLSKMSRINDLIIIKIVTEDRVHWALFDSEHTPTFRVEKIDITALVIESLLSPKDASMIHVLDFAVAGNALIAHYRDTKAVQNNKSRSRGSQNGAVLCRRLKKMPTLQCFSNADEFVSIFTDDKTRMLNVDSNEYLTLPFLLPFDQQEVTSWYTTTVTFFGIGDGPSRRHKRSPSCSYASGLFESLRGTQYVLSNR